MGADREETLRRGRADFVICLYNPSSRKRADYLEKACEIILKSRSEETVCGLVKNIGREGELYEIMTLKKLKTTQADMFTTVISETQIRKS